MADSQQLPVEESEAVSRPEQDDIKSVSSELTEDDEELNGPLKFLKTQMEAGTGPDTVLRNLLGPSVQIPPDADEVSLWEAVLELVFRPAPRDPLPDVTTVEHVISLIENSSKIIVLSGAGISVSCGIPDFRSANGIYARLAVEFPELVEPQAMFDIRFFEIDPNPFFRFAKEIFPGKYTPSPCHRFISTLEKKGKLLRNYTQNIDTLEREAGINRAIYCHGSFSTATCRVCKHQVQIDELKDIIMREEVPYCVECTKLKTKKQRNSRDDDDDDGYPVGVMKPDIVFFGEGLPDTFHKQLEKDKMEADLLIVIGSSLKVRPVSLIPDMLPHSIPRVLINKENLHYIKGFDVRLLGYGDTIVGELCSRLGGDWAESVGGAKSTKAVWSPEERIYVFDGGVWHKETTPTSTVNGESSHSDDVICNHGNDTNNNQTISPLKRSPPDDDNLEQLFPQSKLPKEDHALDNTEP